MSRKMTAVIISILVMLSACSPLSDSSPTPEPASADISTPTPTVIPGGGVDLPTVTTASRCEGLNGALEVQILVGPADAVGLEPVAVGEIPFAVVSAEEPYIIEGRNAISYDEVLAQEWGTYAVSMNLDFALTGECGGEEGAEQLMVVVNMSGDQLVEVEAEGFQGEYPWSGTQQLDLSFPLEEGATAAGEGWQFVLHLGQ